MVFQSLSEYSATSIASLASSALVNLTFFDEGPASLAFRCSSRVGTDAGCVCGFKPDRF